MALAWVNSFHLFVDADVGASGRAGDNGVLKNSHLLQQIRQNPEAWLGPRRARSTAWLPQTVVRVTVEPSCSTP